VYRDFVAVDAIAWTSDEALVPYHPSRLRHPYAAVAATGDEVETLDYLLRVMFVQYNLGWWGWVGRKTLIYMSYAKEV
jgi:hypothetical protein